MSTVRSGANASTRTRSGASSLTRTTARTRRPNRDGATSAISAASRATQSQSLTRSSTRSTSQGGRIDVYYLKDSSEDSDTSAATIEVSSDDDDSYGSSVSQKPASMRRGQSPPSSRGQKRERNIHPKSPPSKRKLPPMSANFTHVATPPSTQSSSASTKDAEMIDLTRDSSEEPPPPPPQPQPQSQPPRPARQRPPLQETRTESFEFIQSPSTSTVSAKKKPEVSSESTSSFLQDMFKNGVDLPISIIAHNKVVQASMDKLRIAWSVQYTLAQGVSSGRWTWDGVLPKLHALQGNDDEVLPKTESVVYGSPCYLDKESAFQIGKQARLEDLAIMENQGAGMAISTFHGEPKWFGGRIQQVAQLKQLPDETYKVVLQPLEMARGKSTRFARYLGSRRIIKLSVTDKLLRQQEVQDYLRQVFVVCGRMFVPWVSKEGSLYLVETDQNYERDSCRSLGDHFRKSYASIFEWHNSPTLNQSQPWAKFVTRNVLGLSTSVPGIEFDADNIEYISDAVAEDWDMSKGDAPAEKLLTDGCGFMNQAAFTQLTFNLELAAQPTAVQGRIAGNKGLWVMHPDDNEGLVPKIWIRKSQHKINHVKPYERSYRIFDVVSCGNPPNTVSLSSQSIIILWHNGISSEVLKGLMKDGIEREVRPLMADGETGPLALLKLWDAVARAGAITGQRVARHAAGMGRVLGVVRRKLKETNEYDEAFVAGDEEPQVYTGRSAQSGSPHNLSEVAVEVIQAGYTPAKSSFLHHKIYYLIKTVLASSTSEYRIPLPEGTSREAFVIPDPHHVLKAGEVFFYSSEPLMDPKTRMIRNIPVGEALIGRYPIRLPNDIQKVTVVDRHELYHYKDVIVIPVEGSTSFMQLLSGGDFDGDTAFLIWLEDVVDHFKNQPFSPPPDKFLEDHFTRSKEDVGSFCKRLLRGDVREPQQEFFKTLMTGLTNGDVGKYSVMHENALYKYGAEDPRAICLAYKFNTMLDSSKTGYVLRPNVLQQDSREFSQRPLCFSPKGVPPKAGSLFVLDVIKAHVQQLADNLLNEYKKLEPKLTTADDPMFREWSAFTTSLRSGIHSTFPEEKIMAKQSEVFLLQVKNHVHASWTEWRRAMSKNKADKMDHELAQKEKKRRKSPENARDITDKAARMYAAPLAAPEDPDGRYHPIHLMLLDKIKAYIAYCEDMRYPDELRPSGLYPNDSFAFCVAFTQLCDMQAERSETGHATSIRGLDEMRGIGKAGRKILDAS